MRIKILSELVTLSKNDPKFRSMLVGTFSKSKLALPVAQPVGSDDSQSITFRVVDKSTIKSPHFFKIIFKLFSLNWLLLSLSSVLMFYFFSNDPVLPLNSSVVGSFVASLVLIHCFVFSLNDYYDYINGADRLGANARVKPIQKGWIKADTVARISFIMLFLAGYTASLLVQVNPVIFTVLSIAGVALGFLYSFKKGLKSLGLGEFVVFVCYGPLLACVISFSFKQELDLNYVLAGLFFGAAAAFNLGLKQLQNIMYDDKSSNKTLMVRLGFDKAKYILSLQLISLVFFYFYTGYLLYVEAKFLGVTAGSFLLFNLFLIKKIKAIQSPLSSEIKRLRILGNLIPLVGSTLLISSLYLNS